jgi:acyl transferase domain-containing protein/thioesterase domain-containing protein
MMDTFDRGAVAVVAMSGRFPGSRNVRELWSNLLAGVDAICDFNRPTLLQAGVPSQVLDNPDFVPSYGVLDDSDCFDEKLFGYSPREACLIDPQQRIFLECAWEALEEAGRNPRRNAETVGVFAGASSSKYLLFNLLRNPATYLDEEVYGEDLIPAFSGSHYLTSRVAFKLGLNGPTISVAAACASSLVAVVLACQNLQDFTCDVAIAGGSSIGGRGPRGYLAKRGGMASRSGRCRSFDALADGSVFSDGAGCVVLKRLEDAKSNGDQIHAIIRGWATNNDGRDRVGFSAPSMEGQAAVIAEAMIRADVAPSDIGYVEAHGSGTQIGDPIEFAALNAAFKQMGFSERNSCGLGSIKSNIGHLDSASGIAGLIKAILCVREGVLPGTLHFSNPNPAISIEDSQFFIDRSTRAFPGTHSGPRVASISSFGLGGVNAHLVIQGVPEENRPLKDEVVRPSTFAIPIGATTEAALERQLSNYEQRADAPADLRLCDAAEAAARRNADMPLRCVATGRNWQEVQQKIERIRRERDWREIPSSPALVTYLVAGVGQQYRGMANKLHAESEIFRAAFDKCAQAAAELGIDLGWALVPSTQIDLLRNIRASFDPSVADAPTSHAALFATAYATRTFLDNLGVNPSRMAGHSLGELIALGLAGAIEPRAAMHLIIERARLCDQARPGSMMAVPLPAAELEAYCLGDVSVAVVNTSDNCALSGPADQMARVHERLREAGILAMPLPTTTAYHSKVMTEIAPRMRDLIARFKFAEPRVPVYSVALNRPLGAADLVRPDYWIEHLAGPVHWQRFVEQLVAQGNHLFLEIGPGSSLCEFGEEIARAKVAGGSRFIPTLAAGYAASMNPTVLLTALGELWQHKHPIQWSNLNPNARAAFAGLPTYPFERTVHWIDAALPPAIFAGMKGETDAKTSPQARSSSELPRPPAPIAKTAQSDNDDSPYPGPPDRASSILCRIWSRYLGRAVTPDDNFLEIGGSSLLGLQLASAVWREMSVEIPVRRILEEGTIAKLCAALNLNDLDQARSVEVRDVQLTDLPHQERRDAVLTWLISVVAAAGLAVPPNAETPFTSSEIDALTPDLIRAFRKRFDVPIYPNEIVERRSLARIADLALTVAEGQPALTHVEGPPGDPLARIGRVAFVLSSVRSGSTLLRVMLAGHSGLFCPPELHLLPYSDIREREAMERSPDRDQGLYRALAELLGEDAAGRKLARYRDQNVSTDEVFRDLVQASSPRLFVDKSPGNTNSLDALRRAEMLFDRPIYIHLIRHPYAVIDSVIQNRFVEMLGFGHLDPQTLGELMWQRSNSNILDHLATVEPERQISIRYEDLVREPEHVMRGLSDHLGIPYEDALVTPYEGRRMRDGLGDPNFHRHGRIRADLANAWVHARVPKPLGWAAKILASKLGYELSVRDHSTDWNGSPLPLQSPISNAAAETSSVAPCQTVRLDGADKDDAGPVLLCCHALDGTIDLYRVLARKLAGAAAVYGIEQLVTADDIPALCAGYAAALAEFKPQRTLSLCGWSFGGIVAFELARQLRERGRDVSHLYIFDTPAPRDRPRKSSGLHVAARQFAQSFAASAGTTLALGELDHEDMSRLDSEAILTRLARRLIDANLIDDALPMGEFSRRFQRFAANLSATERYQASPLDGATTLVRAVSTLTPSEYLPQSEGEANRWPSLITGGLNILDVQATHYSLLTSPAVDIIAERLLRILTPVQIPVD